MRWLVGPDCNLSGASGRSGDDLHRDRHSTQTPTTTNRKHEPTVIAGPYTTSSQGGTPEGERVALSRARTPNAAMDNAEKTIPRRVSGRGRRSPTPAGGATLIGQIVFLRKAATQSDRTVPATIPPPT